MRTHFSRRGGLNIGEVIVIVLLVLVLAALILPGVQSVRNGGGRRAECLNNLRQLGVAMHNYQEFFGRLPPSGVWDVTDPSNYAEWTDLGGVGKNSLHQSTMRYSWALQLLPFLDHSDVYDQWDFNPSAPSAGPIGVDAKEKVGFGSYWLRSTAKKKDGGNFQLGDTNIKVLTCTSDPTTIPGKGNLSYVVNGGFSYHWRLDYATSGGDGRGALLDFSDDVQRRWSENVRNSGLFFLETSEAYSRSFSPALKTSDRRSLGLTDVDDGLAETVMMSENINAGTGAVWESDAIHSNWACPHPWNTSFFVNGVVTPPGAKRGMNFAAANTRGRDAPPQNPFGGQGGINGELTSEIEGRFPYPNSGHPQAVNVLFCDGSARSISQNIDAASWTTMVTPNGGKFVQLSNGVVVGEPATKQDD
jgi:prepilin-type processing-associated H-X9-DG protein